MSAYVVNQEHIDAMLRAGLHYGRDYRLTWHAKEERAESDFQPGEPWGDTAVENAIRLRRELTIDTCNETGRMLLMENVRSVAHRYDEPLDAKDLPGPCDLDILSAVYPIARITRSPLLEPVAILKAISCYEYQSCEHPGWETSEAHEFCDALRSAAINALPGYKDAAWSIGG